MVAHLPWAQGVAGSSPATQTNNVGTAMKVRDLLREVEPKDRDLPVYVQFADTHEPVPLATAKTQTLFVLRGVDDNDVKRYGKVTGLVLGVSGSNSR